MDSDKFLPLCNRKRKRRWNGMVEETGGDFNPQVWGRTPLDILRHILTFLPLPSLCRFKSVSKPWYSAISSGTLNVKFKRQRWYIMVGVRCLGLLDGNAGSAWKLIDVPNLETKYTFRIVFSSSHAGLAAGLKDTCTGEGGKKVVVFNPLVLKSWIQLPQPPQLTKPGNGVSRTIFFGIQAQDAYSDDRKTSYTVVMLLGFSPRDEYYKLELEVFNSIVGRWISTPIPAQVLGNTGELICVSQAYQDCMVLREDHLYFITVRRDNTRSLKSMNIWNPWDLKTIATWTTLPLHQVPYSYVTSFFPGLGTLHCRLAHCAGKFVLVGVIPFTDQPAENSNSRDEEDLELVGPLGTVGFLALDEKEAHKGWQPLASLPLDLDILPGKLRKGVDGRICAAASEDEVTVFVRDHPWGCIYNVTSGTWRSAFGKDKIGFGQAIFPFTPSLANLF